MVKEKTHKHNSDIRGWLYEVMWHSLNKSIKKEEVGLCRGY